MAIDQRSQMPFYSTPPPSHRAQTAVFQTLELLETILNNLSFLDLAACQNINHYFSTTIQSSSLLRSKVSHETVQTETLRYFPTSGGAFGFSLGPEITTRKICPLLTFGYEGHRGGGAPDCFPNVAARFAIGEYFASEANWGNVFLTNPPVSEAWISISWKVDSEDFEGSYSESRRIETGNGEGLTVGGLYKAEDTQHQSPKKPIATMPPNTHPSAKGSSNHSASQSDGPNGATLDRCEGPARNRNENETDPEQKDNLDASAAQEQGPNQLRHRQRPDRHPIRSYTHNPQPTPTPKIPLPTTCPALILHAISLYITLKTTSSRSLYATQARSATLLSRLHAMQAALDKLLELYRQGLLPAAEAAVVNRAAADFAELTEDLVRTAEEAEGLRRQIDGIGIGTLWRGIWGRRE
ncbi:hypothetical protein Q7P35_009667 [Cladosporium inversicolor]